MHLIIAMILLYEKLGDKITVTGGDTDSLKIRCDESITNDILLDALKPLHEATRNALSKTMQRVRELYPDMASELNGIGEFECEKCGGYDRWKYHLEAWNKARISISQDMKPHVTCAGLSRPIGTYNIDNVIHDFIDAGYSIEKILNCILGYNVFITHELCFALEHRKPNADDILDIEVTDYLGNTSKVCQTEAIAIYDSGRMLGDTHKRTNADNLRYLKEVQKLDIDDSEKWIQFNNDKSKVQILIGGDVAYEANVQKIL